MTFWLIVLLAFAAAAFLLCFCLLGILVDKKKKRKEYDERQQLMHAKAGCWAACAGGVFLMVIYFLDIFLPDGVQMELPSLIMVVVTLEVAVAAFYCTFTGASIPILSSPIRTSVILFAAAGLGILNAVLRVYSMRLTPNEDGTRLIVIPFHKVVVNWQDHGMVVYMYLLLGMICLFLGVIELLRYFRQKGE